MKNLIVSIIAMLIMASFTTVAFAAGGPVIDVGGGSTIVAELPDSLPMIRSSMELLSWAKSRVCNAYAYGGSYGPVIPGGCTIVQVGKEDPDIRVISTLLSESMLDFRVVLPEEVCYLGASMADANGYQLFYGQSYFYLSQDGEGWSVPQGAADITMQLVENVPIPAPGVNWAGLYLKDDNGNTTYRPISAGNGYIWFPQSLTGVTNAGWTAILTIYNSKGGKVYDLRTGEAIAGTPVKVGVNASIERLVTLDDPLMVKDNPKSVNGQGRRGWYQVKISSTRAIILSGETTEGELAISVTIRNATESAESVTLEIPTGLDILEFDEGVYDIWFEYPEFDRDEPVIPPYYYGGGMG